MDIKQIELNIVRALLHHVQTEFSDDAEAEQFASVLDTYLHSMRRRHDKTPLTFEQHIEVKRTIRSAAQYINQLAGRRDEEAELILKVLWSIVEELTQEDMANEALYPELKFAFDRDRENYRSTIQ